ncbi:MAG: tellurite resistance TerB family protein [Alphaproteobacteria bacterium]|nr:tellurite resistance TerB family protein [Alphaproteobacteria bacterium]
MSTISPETALVYIMVTVSASDDEMTDSELNRMTGVIGYLPAFRNYNIERLRTDTNTCIELLQSEEGLDAVLGLIDEAVPDSHIDLVYGLACEIAASDGSLSQEELRLLEMFRHYFDIDRLTAAAIERGVAARQKTFS